jgi:hypothetical protein
VIEALDSYQIDSQLVWDYYKSLMRVPEQDTIHGTQSVCVPGHTGTEGNEIADQLATMGSEFPFISPEPFCGTSAEADKMAIG